MQSEEKTLIQKILQERVKFFYNDRQEERRDLILYGSKELMSPEEEEIDYFERTGNVSVSTLVNNHKLFKTLKKELDSGDLDKNKKLKNKVLEAYFRRLDEGEVFDD